MYLHSKYRAVKTCPEEGQRVIWWIPHWQKQPKGQDRLTEVCESKAVPRPESGHDEHVELTRPEGSPNHRIWRSLRQTRHERQKVLLESGVPGKDQRDQVSPNCFWKRLGGPRLLLGQPGEHRLEQWDEQQSQRRHWPTDEQRWPPVYRRKTPQEHASVTERCQSEGRQGSIAKSTSQNTIETKARRSSGRGSSLGSIPRPTEIKWRQEPQVAESG